MRIAGPATADPVLSRWIGRLSGVGEPFRAPQRFVLAGVEWQGPAQASIELRAHRARGGWTRWLPASVLGHDSDRGETIAHALVGEPIWTGAADAVQLRSSAPVDGLNLHLVLAAAVADSAASAQGPGYPAAPEQRPGYPAAPEQRPRHSGTDVHQQRSARDAAATEELPLATPDLPAGPGQPPIIARSAWAQSLIPRAAPSYGDVRVAFVHHSVNGNGYSSAEVPAILRSIYVFHTYVRGWNDFGYNFAVDAYGRIWEGRAGGIDRPVIGAQAGGYNAESFGVVLVGDFAAALPTLAARRALSHLIAWKLALHGVPARGRVRVEVDPSDAHYTRFRPGQHIWLPRVAAHRDGCTTDCPGYDMYVNGMPALRAAVADLAVRQHTLTLEAGPASGSAYALAPYQIAPGTRIAPATYLDLQTVTITADRQLPLHGFMRSASGDPLANVMITIQDLSATRQDDPMSDLALAVTRHDGLWVALVKPHRNMLLRALHAEAPATVSPLMVAAVRPELTLSVEPAAGRVRVLGTVTPSKRHILIEVRAAGGARQPARRTTVEAQEGVFAATLRLAPGRYWITARTQADATNVAGESPAVAVRL